MKPNSKTNLMCRIRSKGNLSVLTVGALFAVAFSSCLSEQFSQQADISKTAAEVFDYKTSVNTSLSITVKNMQDKPVAGVVIDVYFENPYDGSTLKGDSVKIKSVMSGSDGVISSTLNIPNHVTEVYLVTKYPGYANPLKITPANGSINLVLHPAGYGDVSLRDAEDNFAPAVILGNNVYKMGSYNSSGVPTYMEPTRDIIGDEFKNRIKASFPEKVHLPKQSPGYLTDVSSANIRVVQNNTQIWVTFVSEGADWKNTLGYFYYPTGSSPATAANIAKRVVIFPNSSLKGSNGNHLDGLAEGDKVKLRYCDNNGVWTDKFPAGVTVSWFLIADGYSTGAVSNGKYWNYSLPAFNESGLQQNVILFDAASNRMVMGFEDTKRNAEGTSGDEDFNDAMFYLTSNPLTGIDKGTTVTKQPEDADKDGVVDEDDKFPTDPKRAFYETAQGSLTFEDNWPYKGDYDFNDFVTDYSFVNVTNAQNKVIDINATFQVRAAGANFRNGFALQLGTTPANVASVSGSRLFGNLFSLNGIGVENGQAKAVIPVVDNITTLLQGPMVNTVPDGTTAAEQTISMAITLTNAVDPATLGLPPYNPFLVVNQERGREVHLPGQLPTTLANPALFGTGDDKTNPSVAATCYKANQAYPWALNISEKLFAYPIEKERIDQTHLKFATWVTSLGAQFGDWYSNKANYRVAGKIYNK